VNLPDLIERFSKTPLKQRVAGLVLLSAIFGALFYFMFYSDLSDKAESLQRQIRLLENEKADYQRKKAQYEQFRAEVTKLLEERKELVKVLPSEAEIEVFLQSLHAQAELAGLNILTFQQGPEQKKGFYAIIPVKMQIRGTYFQINKFFYSVGRLKRIVNIRDLQLTNPAATDTGVMLKADFIVTTFRFLQATPAVPGAHG